jgi:putative transposase
MKTRIKDELIDELLNLSKDPSDLLGSQGLLNELKKRLIERTMDAELSHNLGYAKHARGAAKKDNSRNGHSKKTVRTTTGPLEIEVPRDRNGDYEPQIIGKHERHFDGFDEAILSLYARGLTVRETQEHLRELYDVDVSAAFISTVTDQVVDEVKNWQSRPLDRVYPIVFFDAIVAKVRHEGKVSNRAIYLALAVNMDGKKELLGMWSSQNEGSKFWLQVLTELKNRGLEDIFICCVDGLKGFSQAIETVYPDSQVQLCIVHMVRNSLRFVGYKERRKVAAELKTIYRASSVEAAEQAFRSFKEQYAHRYPAIIQSWDNHWQNIIPFFSYPEDIRKVIYTTNAIESLNSSLRKISRSRNLFPSEESVYKLFYLALKNVSKKWTMPIPNWAAALNRFTIEFPERCSN